MISWACSNLASMLVLFHLNSRLSRKVLYGLEQVNQPTVCRGDIPLVSDNTHDPLDFPDDTCMYLECLCVLLVNVNANSFLIAR